MFDARIKEVEISLVKTNEVNNALDLRGKNWKKKGQF